jgi:hypothetical protein
VIGCDNSSYSSSLNSPPYATEVPKAIVNDDFLGPNVADVSDGIIHADGDRVRERRIHGDDCRDQDESARPFWSSLGHLFKEGPLEELDQAFSVSGLNYLEQARQAIKKGELMPGRFIRVRKMKEQEGRTRSRDDVDIADAMTILPKEKVEAKLEEEIEKQGGLLKAIESGWVRGEIARSAYARQKEIASVRDNIIIEGRTSWTTKG